MEGRDDIGFRLKRINIVLQQNANAALKDYDLTLSQVKVLYYLEHKEKGAAKLKELEKYFAVSQPTMAGIAARLEDKQFVESFTDPQDRRIKVLQLSEKGKEVCHKTAAQAESMEERINAALGETNVKQLRRLLDLLYAGITKGE